MWDDSRGALDGWWDVARWVFGPPVPYRVNSLYRLDRAVVTVTGVFDTADAAADLAAHLHRFDPLPTPMVVDLCHGVLDERAAGAVVEARRRRRFEGRSDLVVRHAGRSNCRLLSAAQRRQDAERPDPSTAKRSA